MPKIDIKKTSKDKKNSLSDDITNLTEKEKVALQSSVLEIKNEINAVFKDMFEETTQQLEDLNAENRLIKKRMRKLESMYLPQEPEEEHPQKKYPKSPDHCYHWGIKHGSTIRKWNIIKWWTIRNISDSSQIKLIASEIVIPTFAYPSDVAVDLRSRIGSTLEPFQIKGIPTGIAIELPGNLERQIRPRSV